MQHENGTAGPAQQIDPEAPGARERLAKLYPRVVVDEVLVAPRDATADAIEYLRAKSERDRAQERLDAIGNRLCAAIGDAKGIKGPGFTAMWAEQVGQVDLEALRAALKVKEARWKELLEEHRKPPTRRLVVTRKE